MMQNHVLLVSGGDFTDWTRFRIFCLCPDTVLFGLVLWCVEAWSTGVAIHHRCAFPLVLLGPAERQNFDCTRLHHGVKRIKRLYKDLALEFRLVWFSSGVPERKVKKSRTWGIPGFEDIERATHTHSRDPFSFSAP